MVFWLAVLVGGLFAWIAVQIGFYATWILFFNLLLSAYVAIVLTPVLIVGIPDATATPYGYALILMTTAIATLAIAYGLSFACVSGRLRADFPRAFDNVGAGLLGFLAGFLVWSFLAFAFCLTPASQIGICKTFGFDSQSQKANTAYMCWWCDRVHGFVSARGAPSSKELARALLARVPASSTPPTEGPQPGAPPDAPKPPVPPAPLAPAAKGPGQPNVGQPTTLVNETPEPAKAEPGGLGAEPAVARPPRPVRPVPSPRRVESVEEEFARRHMVANTPDAVEAAVASREVGIIEVADGCNVERFDPQQIALLQHWVSDGGMLWANNNVLSLFGVRHSKLVQWGEELHCTVSENAEAAAILADCKRVALRDIGGKAHTLSSKGVMPLLTLETDIPFKHKAGTACWSLVPYGKGWISDAKTVDMTQDDGARFWHNFCRFCLKKELPAAPSGGGPFRGEPSRTEPSRTEPAFGDPFRPEPSSSAEQPALPKTSERGLSGIWQASTGARFRIRDDGKTLTINLLSSDAIQVFSGRLARRDDGADSQSFAGALDAVFAVDAPRRYVIGVTATLGEAGHLRLRCADWPKWNNRGKLLGKGMLTEIWTRADSSREW